MGPESSPRPACQAVLPAWAVSTWVKKCAFLYTKGLSTCTHRAVSAQKAQICTKKLFWSWQQSCPTLKKKCHWGCAFTSAWHLVGAQYICVPRTLGRWQELHHRPVLDSTLTLETTGVVCSQLWNQLASNFLASLVSNGREWRTR
jgi:hypothetical protein